jgi:hypothetical protein
MWALVLLVLGSAWAQTADEVVAKARAANQVSSSIQMLRLTHVKPSGQRVREMELRTRREGDVLKTYMRYTTPSDVAGMAFQQIDNPGKSDELLMWQPAYQRTQRISGSARTGVFFGDFTYEDLEIRSAADGVHTFGAGATSDAWVIDTKPVDGSNYSKIVTTISKSDLVAKKVQFYDKTGALAKELSVVKTLQEGTRTIVVETEMRDAKKDSKTRIEVLSHRYDLTKEELPDETFTPAYLEKG